MNLSRESSIPFHVVVSNEGLCSSAHISSSFSSREREQKCQQHYFDRAEIAPTDKSARCKSNTTATATAIVIVTAARSVINSAKKARCSASGCIGLQQRGVRSRATVLLCVGRDSTGSARRRCCRMRSHRADRRGMIGAMRLRIGNVGFRPSNGVLCCEEVRYDGVIRCRISRRRGDDDVGQ